jgi:uncharacterized protein (DUF433 family)
MARMAARRDTMTHAVVGWYCRPVHNRGSLFMNALLDRIWIDPAICGGKPCIKDTRLWVSLILDFLADGMTEAQLIEEYPQLTHQDVMAAIAYGAEMSLGRRAYEDGEH